MPRTIVAGLLVALLTYACKADPAAQDAGTEPAAPRPIRVATDRKDLLYSYAEGNEYRTATEISQIPAAARSRVVVTDLSLSPTERQAGRYVYVADLSAPAEDGTFPVSISSRYGFETLTATTAGAPSTAGVVIYSASWCGVCKQAKRLLKAWNVPFVEKDIEASRSAQTELAQKAQAAGVQPTGVPVIDVGGTLLLGLDEAALRRALQAKGLL
ncbi:MAG: glutaredoxin family protein [Deltaproteobacteria bacterium]|jgi:glutaredoxin|nr:glutaredoxin family protein [Deltaproteobacteria bacterium]